MKVSLKNKSMKFKGLNGYIEEGSSYISLNIEGGEKMNCIGDQMWISPCGTKMEISENSDQEVFEETMELFEGISRRAFKGALMRMGINF